MVKQKKIVLYELNEVPRRVLQDFVIRSPRSALARLLARGAYFDTITEDKGVLSPWITWPTLHRGVTNEKHCISDFGQDLAQVNDEYPSFPELVARAGKQVGVFGSLHTYPLPPDVHRYAFYVPDTFANGSECFPETLAVFQDFNLRMMDVSGRNVSHSVLLGPSARFIAKAPKLGLRVETALRLTGQLLAEGANRARVGRRRTSQVQIAFDLFVRQLELNKPDLCTFFTNHVASSMHRYWPAKFPQDYSETDLGEKWRTTYRGEIDFTMSEADRQLSRLVAFVEQHPDYVLMVASSMGQSAVDASQVIHSQLYIQDATMFMQALGVGAQQWLRHRAMLPRYIFKVSDDSVAGFRSALKSFTINGEPVTVVELGNNIFQLKLGQENLSDKTTVAYVNGRRRHLSELGLVNTPIQDESGSYAYHIPQGILLIYDPADRRGRAGGTITTRDIAPTILANFGVARPGYMTAGLH